MNGNSTEKIPSLPSDAKTALLAKRQIGDNLTVASMMEITPEYVCDVLAGRKHNEKVWRALARVVESREQLVREAQLA